MNPVATQTELKLNAVAAEPKIHFAIEDIRKSFKNGFELSIEQLRIRRGNVVSLLGPTGSGKTTFLRSLAGLERLETGSILLDGTQLNEAIQNNNKRIVMVHQNVILVRGTVEQNIQYGLKFRNDDNTATKTDAIINRFKLNDIAKRSIHSLSKGQKTLVGLARAFVLQPEVLLLDEPTSSLDPARVQLIEEAIQKLQNENQTTIVVATHNVFQAKRISNQTVLILDGQMIEASETGEFFNSPKQQTTKDFLEGKIVF